MTATYDFRSLSPLDFEGLVHDLLEAHWGRKLEAFAAGRDQGIDLRHLHGPDRIFVQAKHFVGSEFSGLVRAITLEREKAMRLRPSRYVLATSFSLTPQRKDKLIAAMASVPLESCDIIGRDELNALLRQHPQVEKSHFKLWLGSTAVLDRILHSGVYNRSAAEMDIIQAMVPKFVQNRSIDAAREKLNHSGALIIAGQPGVGKTTLARMLIWLHAEQGWKVSVVDHLDDAFKVADPAEKRIIFFDDFLGQIRLAPSDVSGLDARLPALITRVSTHQNLRFVLTTRDYILAQARDLSARLGPGQINAREYVLDVGTYTRGVKARILYNHLYFSALSPEQRMEILKEDFYIGIIDHPNFNPRLIEEITSQDYLARTDQPIRQTIKGVLDNPDLLWERPYRQHISKEGQLMMLALFLNGRAATIGELRNSYFRVAHAMGREIQPADFEESFRSSFKALEGSVLVLLHTVVIFANPGIRDFLQSVVINDCLVPLLVPAIESVSELRELWAVFLASIPSSDIRSEMTPAWTSALDRMVAGGISDRYDNLELAIAFASELDGEMLDTRVEQGLRDFESVPIGSDEVSSACSLLEKTASCRRFSSLEYRVRPLITVMVAELLMTKAMELSIDDIASLDSCLHEFGADSHA